MVKLTVELISKMKSGYTKKKREETAEQYLNRLTHLYLEGKNIDEVDDSLGLCSRLLVLYLYDNNLNDIPCLANNRHLTHLYLQNNRISRISNLNTLSRLVKLYLGHNSITVLEGLEKLRDLTELHIEHQKLPPGEKLLFDTNSLNALSDSLQYLDVTGNNIDSIKELDCLSKLTCLIARDNELSDLQELRAVLKCLHHLVRLDFAGNPLCAASKYRDNIILVANTLESLDGKEITKMAKDFVLNWYASRDAIRKKNSELSRRATMIDYKYHSADDYPPIEGTPKMASYSMPGLKNSHFDRILAKSASVINIGPNQQQNPTPALLPNSSSTPGKYQYWTTKWLPITENNIMDTDNKWTSWSHLFTVKYCNYTGYVTESSVAFKLVKEYEIATQSHFVALCSAGSMKYESNDPAFYRKRRVHWDDPGHGVKGVKITYDGTPFIVAGTAKLECQYGPDRKKNTKAKKVELATDKNFKTKRKALVSKKTNCPACIDMRKIYRFPDYKIEVDTQWKRLTKSEKLREVLRSAESHTVPYDIRIYIQLPRVETHENHMLGDAGVTSLPIDDQVRSKIQQLVNEGVHSVAEIKERVEHFVKNDLFAGQAPPSDINRRYFPTKVDYMNIRYRAEKRKRLLDSCNVKTTSHELTAGGDENAVMKILHGMDDGTGVTDGNGGDRSTCEVAGAGDGRFNDVMDTRDMRFMNDANSTALVADVFDGSLPGVCGRSMGPRRKLENGGADPGVSVTSLVVCGDTKPARGGQRDCVSLCQSGGSAAARRVCDGGGSGWVRAIGGNDLGDVYDRGASNIAGNVCDGSIVNTMVRSVCDSRGANSVMGSICDTSCVNNIVGSVCDSRGVNNMADYVCDRRGAGNIATSVCDTRGAGNMEEDMCDSRGANSIATSICDTRGAGNIAGSACDTRSAGNTAGSVGNIAGSAGNIAGSVCDTRSAGNIAGSVCDTRSAGNIVGSVCDTRSAGNIAGSVCDTRSAGNIAGSVCDTRSAGNIAGSVCSDGQNSTILRVFENNGHITLVNRCDRIQDDNAVSSVCDTGSGHGKVGNIRDNGTVLNMYDARMVNVYNIRLLGNASVSTGNNTGNVPSVSDVSGQMLMGKGPVDASAPDVLGVNINGDMEPVAVYRNVSGNDEMGSSGVYRTCNNHVMSGGDDENVMMPDMPNAFQHELSSVKTDCTEIVRSMMDVAYRCSSLDAVCLLRQTLRDTYKCFVQLVREHDAEGRL